MNCGMLKKIVEIWIKVNGSALTTALYHLLKLKTYSAHLAGPLADGLLAIQMRICSCIDRLFLAIVSIMHLMIFKWAETDKSLRSHLFECFVICIVGSLMGVCKLRRACGKIVIVYSNVCQDSCILLLSCRQYFWNLEYSFLKQDNDSAWTRFHSSERAH